MWKVRPPGLSVQADVWHSDTKGGSEGHAALHLDCEQAGGKTRGTAAQQGEKKNSSDAEETDGASQQDASSPRPRLKEMSEILGSEKSPFRLTFIIFCIFALLQVGKVDV